MEYFTWNPIEYLWKTFSMAIPLGRFTIIINYQTIHACDAVNNQCSSVTINRNIGWRTPIILISLMGEVSCIFRNIGHGETCVG